MQGAGCRVQGAGCRVQGVRTGVLEEVGKLLEGNVVAPISVYLLECLHLRECERERERASVRECVCV